MNYKFPKAERLNSKKIINQLFEKGSEKTNSVFLYPFRVVYLSISKPSENPTAILISISKRSFKKAVDRNLIKRRMKEAYRLNKSIIHENGAADFPSNIAFMYVGKEILPYALIESKMKIVLQKIADHYLKGTSINS
jgi:ribonuclease P protein component